MWLGGKTKNSTHQKTGKAKKGGTNRTSVAVKFADATQTFNETLCPIQPMTECEMFDLSKVGNRPHDNRPIYPSKGLVSHWKNKVKQEDWKHLRFGK